MERIKNMVADYNNRPRRIAPLLVADYNDYGTDADDHPTPYVRDDKETTVGHKKGR